MINQLFKLDEEEEIKIELRRNTNYFQIKEKYRLSRKFLRSLKKMNRVTIDQSKKRIIDDMYGIAENRIPDIVFMKEDVEKINKCDIESYIDKCNPQMTDNEIVNIVEDSKLKVSTVNKVLRDVQLLIYHLSDTTFYGIYLEQEQVIDICEMYQLLTVIEREIKTIPTRVDEIDFCELSNDILERYFIQEWGNEIIYICEELSRYIMELVGFNVGYNSLENYNDILRINDFFVQLVITYNNETAHIERLAKEFDKDDYIEYLKENPLKYLEYLKDFGTSSEYEEYKSKIEDKLLGVEL